MVNAVLFLHFQPKLHVIVELSFFAFQSGARLRHFYIIGGGFRIANKFFKLADLIFKRCYFILERFYLLLSFLCRQEFLVYLWLLVNSFKYKNSILFDNLGFFIEENLCNGMSNYFNGVWCSYLLYIIFNCYLPFFFVFMKYILFNSSF